MSRSSALARHTGQMATGTLLSRITGLLRIFALAYALGIGGLGDAYNLANNTPNMIYDLVLGGVLSATLIPVFVQRLAVDDDDDAWRAISAVVTVSTVVSVVASVVLAVLAPQIIDLYTIATHARTAGIEREVATTLLRLFAPQLVGYAGVTLVAAVLNARGRFAAPAWSPILNNLIVIGILLAFALIRRHPQLASVRHDEAAVLMLGLGTTAGVIVQWLALLPSLRASGSQLRWRWEPAHQAIKTVLRLSGYTLLIVISNQVALFVILTLAASRPGGVSAYTYAYAFFQAPYGVLAVSVMTAMQPRLARAWALTDIAGFLRGVAMGLRMVVVVMLLPTVALLVLGKPLAGLVLAHGATGAAGAKTAGAALVWLGLGLPGFSAYLYLVRCYQAMQDLRTPFWLYVVENGINVGAGYALYQAAGVAGLAASLSLAYTVAAVLGAIRLRTQVGRIGIRALVTSLQRLALPLAAFVVVALAVQRPIPSGGTRWLLVRVVVAVVAGTAAFAVVAGVGAHAHDRRRVMPRRAVSAD